MKSKRAVLLFGIVLLLAIGTYPLAAQKPAVKAASMSHPLEGTWKLKVAQSKLSPNQPDAPKEDTMVFRVAGDHFEYTETGMQKDGKPIAEKWTFYPNGGVVKALQSAAPEGESFVETVIEPGNRYLTILKDGKQIGVSHLVISRDGKSLTITDKGTDAKGKPYESVSVYNRQ